MLKLACVRTRALVGVSAVPVLVEAHLGGGLPSFSIVGMAETSVKESRDRVRAAIQNSGFEFHTGKVIVNLAPAELPKHGGRYDLPIALTILAASNQIPASALDQIECIGELALGGELRGISGALPTALGLRNSERYLIVPSANSVEASMCRATRVVAADHLLEVCRALCTQEAFNRVAPAVASVVRCSEGDMSEVKGQYQVKRALEIAAAGRHNLLLTGPPGTGKSMLANRLPGILPTMSEWEATETATVASISNSGFSSSHWGQRPFRAPHHTSSGVALVGGGSPPKPGEISLAHHGVLFLDELPEFTRGVLDVLREPMETGCITISRANWQADFPARFQVVAAMNPCPCGYDGDLEIECRCTPDQISRYQSKVSGPFLDRIDICVHVPRLSYRELRETPGSVESSVDVQRRVSSCRVLQLERQGCANANLESKNMDSHCELSDANARLLDEISERLHLSLRAHVRVLRLARTIADLAEVENIGSEHLLEAVSYRHKR